MLELLSVIAHTIEGDITLAVNEEVTRDVVRSEELVGGLLRVECDGELVTVLLNESLNLRTGPEGKLMTYVISPFLYFSPSF